MIINTLWEICRFEICFALNMENHRGNDCIVSGSNSKIIVGVSGENIAADYIKNHGYRILDRNVRVGPDEIDIISRDRDGSLVFVEVKSMKTNGKAVRDSSIGLIPEDNFTKKKESKFHRACNVFIAKHQELIREDAGWKTMLITLTINNTNVVINTYDNV